MKKRCGILRGFAMPIDPAVNEREFPSFLDTCVLFPQTLRDVLLTAADSGLFFPLWSSDLVDEMERNLIENRGLTRQQTAHLREEMIGAFPDSTILGYEPLIPTMTNHEGGPAHSRCRRSW
jgi:hypothetical protein